MQTTFKSIVTLGALAAFAESIEMTSSLAEMTISDSLPGLKADPHSVTISGMSAGAHNSCHMMILMSDTIKGAGCTKGGAFMSGYSEFRDEDNKDADFFANRALDWIFDPANK